MLRVPSHLLPFLLLPFVVIGCLSNNRLPTTTPAPASQVNPSPTPVQTAAERPTASVVPLAASTPTVSPMPQPLASSPVPSAAFDRRKFGTIEHDVIYCTANGVPLGMDIYYPAAPGLVTGSANSGQGAQAIAVSPFRVAVYVHGGAWMIGSKSANEGLVDIPVLVARGYLVASLDYRLAPTYRFPAQIHDVKCAIRYLRAHARNLNLDPNRIGAWGASAGGHLVSLLALTGSNKVFDTPGEEYASESSAIQAAVDLYGPTDMSAEFEGSNSQIRKDVFGVTSKQDQRLSVASPITYEHKGAPPFLILHGDRDTLVPPSQSQEIFKRLQAVGVPARLVIVKNAEHGFAPVDRRSISPSRAEITKMIADFFDQNLR